MPSPFPGMDPYLESPRLWPDVHHSLISGIRQHLNPQLRPKYIARIEERVYISDETDLGRRVIVPDVAVVAATGHTRQTANEGVSNEEGVEAVPVVELIEQEIHEGRLEILDAQTREVVTVIEVLSPSNKARGSEGRREYMKKRRQIMRSTTHLVEIDLLRGGEAILAGHSLPPHEYGLYRSKAVEGERSGLFWPLRLKSRLPAVTIPLHHGDADVSFDLQTVLNEQYETAGYEEDIDYRNPAEPPLTPELEQWADGLLKSKGLR